LAAFSKVTLTMFPLALGLEETVAPYLTSDFAVEAAAFLIKIVLTLLALVVAICIPSFSFLCALVGLICTMAVSIVFPAAAHLQLFGPRLSLVDRVMDWLFVVLGLAMGILGTIATVNA
jgi:solute carrier family 32 (vesicular inhibitory amino acid transporter)